MPALKAFRLFALVALFAASGRVRADELTYLARGDSALAAFSAAIERAQRSIDLTYFIFDPCHASTRLLTEQLKRKAKSGVRVRVHLDVFMHEAEIHRQVAAEFVAAGAKFRSYNDTLSFSPARNHRTHVKLLLIDGKEYITGGRNIGDDYFSLHHEVNFVDRDVLVRGRSAAQAAAVFEKIWSHGLSREPSLGGLVRRSWAELCPARARAAIAPTALRALEKFVKAERGARLAALPRRQCAKVEFYADDPDFMDASLSSDRDREAPPEDYLNELRLRKKAATREFLRFGQGTRKLLEIENWSYIPSERVRGLFAELRRRQVGVQVITNGTAAAGGAIDRGFDHVMAVAARRDTQGTQAVLQLSRTGVPRDAHALTPKSASFKLHGKVAVRDRRDALVSSYNIDPRSYHTNLESVLVVRDCPEFAADVLAPMNTLKARYLRQRPHGESEAGLFDRVFGWTAFNFL